MKQDNAENAWKGFLELCSKAKSAETLKQLLDLLLTIEEKQMIASRYLIVKALLDEKLTQREIAEAYKVSISQITRGSNALKIIDAKLRKFLDDYVI